LKELLCWQWRKDYCLKYSFLSYSRVGEVYIYARLNISSGFVVINMSGKQVKCCMVISSTTVPLPMCYLCEYLAACVIYSTKVSSEYNMKTAVSNPWHYIPLTIYNTHHGNWWKVQFYKAVPWVHCCFWSLSYWRSCKLVYYCWR